MHTKLRNLFVLIFIGVPFFTACGIGMDHVKLNDPLGYQLVNKEETGADKANVSTTRGKIRIAIRNVRDKRPDITIGVKSTTLGEIMGQVDLEKGVCFIDLFKKHLIHAFELAGYEIVPANFAKKIPDTENIKAFVDAEVRKFWVDFDTGGYLGGIFIAISNVVFEVKMKDPISGEEMWSNRFYGNERILGIRSIRAMCEESINTAYRRAMKHFYKSISDNKLRDMFKK